MVETLLGFRCRPGTRGMDPPGSPASNEGWERGKAGRCLLESFRKRGRQAIAGQRESAASRPTLALVGWLWHSGRADGAEFLVKAHIRGRSKVGEQDVAAAPLISLDPFSKERMTSWLEVSADRLIPNN